MSSAPQTVGAWSAALCDVLLPRGAEGRKVRLDCDEEAIRAAGRALGVAGGRSRRELAFRVADTYGITEARGVTGLAGALERDLALASPDRAPEGIAALALAVLAANKMDADEEASAGAYYHRFREVFGITQPPGRKRIEGFQVMRNLLDALERWLEEVVEGDRGRLEQPHVHGMALIGPVIDQTLLRQRDRYLLNEFHAQHAARIRAGWEPIGLLHGWSGLSGLTRVGQETVHDEAQAEALASLLRAEAAAWDGTRVNVETGQHQVPARLELHFGPSEIILGVAHPHRRERITFREGTWSATAPDGGSAQVPTAWLPRMGAESIRLSMDDDDDLLVLPHGPTLLFRLEEGGGLVHTPNADEEPVWVLTRGEWARAPSFDADRRELDLPAGWTMLDGIEPSRLPDGLIRRGSPGRELAVLIGGLSVGAGIWLSGHPPRLATGELGDPLPVLLDGAHAGRVGSDSELVLPPQAGEVGSHEVRIGQTMLTFSVGLTQVPPEGLECWGALRWDLDTPEAFRRGPISHDDGGPSICGAALRGVDLDEPSVPEVLIRSGVSRVHVVDAEGHCEVDSAPTSSLRLLRGARDIDPEQSWRLDVAEDTCWIVLEGAEPAVICLRALVPATPLAPGICLRFDEVPVRDVEGREDPEAAAVWKRACMSSLGQVA